MLCYFQMQVFVCTTYATVPEHRGKRVFSYQGTGLAISTSPPICACLAMRPHESTCKMGDNQAFVVRPQMSSCNILLMPRASILNSHYRVAFDTQHPRVMHMEGMSVCDPVVITQ